VECRRYGLGRIRCGTRRQMGAFPVGPHLRDTSRSRSSRKKNSPTSSRPGISRQFGTGHRLTPPLLAVAAHRLSAAGSLASVAVSLRTPAPPPRERPLDCASQRLRHPPRQILSNQPIDPPRPPPVVRACRLCCSCGFQFRSLFVPTDCFPL
jgi:hypothetical protein